MYIRNIISGVVKRGVFVVAQLTSYKVRTEKNSLNTISKYYIKTITRDGVGYMDVFRELMLIYYDYSLV